MLWKFDETHAVTNRKIPASVGSAYYAFRQAIRDQRLHPRDAAQQLSITHYENLGMHYYSIRLSLAHRVYFLVNDVTRTVTVLQIGGHR